MAANRRVVPQQERLYGDDGEVTQAWRVLQVQPRSSVSNRVMHQLRAMMRFQQNHHTVWVCSQRYTPTPAQVSAGFNHTCITVEADELLAEQRTA